MIDKIIFRDAMSSFGAAVNVITSDGVAGLAGCTVSAVCSVTDEPPTLMLCINRDSRNNAIFKENGALCINVLSACQQQLAILFSSKGVDVKERFLSAQWERLETGAPVLIDALVALDCKIDSVSEVGTHSVFFCSVQAARSNKGKEALIYLGRNFHCLPTALAA
ncbi:MULTISPECIES: flavin reductase [unclassified Herbaspirillum]|uniref:flavin reductase n=1 Tax=unclassified Herbaspirillum TaxID=2624150 RepID=UPI00383BCE51